MAGTNFISAAKHKVEEIDIMIQAIEEGYISTTKTVAQSKIDYLMRQPPTEYIIDLILRLKKIKRRCKQ